MPLLYLQQDPKSLVAVPDFLPPTPEQLGSSLYTHDGAGGLGKVYFAAVVAGLPQWVPVMGASGSTGATGAPGATGATGIGTTGATGATGAAGSGTGLQFEPARTLFVSQSWPVGSDPLVFFTTIPPALAQAAAMSPTTPDPVAILIYPGTYSAALALVSNVSLVSTARRATIISGPVTWTPGAGINAPQAAVREDIDINSIVFTSSLSIDATAKTGSVSIFDARDSAFRGGVSHIGRSSGVDIWQAWGVVAFNLPLSFDSVNVNFFACSTDALSFTGDSAIDIRGCEIFGNVSISGAIPINSFIEATQINGNVFVGNLCFAGFAGSRLVAGYTLTVALGGTADLRSATFDPASYAGSPGSIMGAKGFAVLGAGGFVVVTNPAITASTGIVLSIDDGGVAPTADVYNSARVVGSSFTIKSFAAPLDVGVRVFYQLW